MILERMAPEIGLSTEFIAKFSRGASYAYKSYVIKKHTGGFREIHHPSKQLKSMQRWLLTYVIASLPLHPAASAYRKERSIFDNAKVHAPNKFLLRMDCKDFFPSITDADVALYIKERQSLFDGWTSLDVDIFCRLVCKGGRLTIGSVTSPGLSNAICYDMDAALSELCLKHGVTFTRYADDLFFSASKPNVLRLLEGEIIQLVAGVKLPANLTINTAKTRHSSRKSARRATGIVLGSDGNPYIGRRLKRRIRSLIHGLDSLSPKTRRSLAGLIAYATGFDPDFMNSLVTKYGHTRIEQARFPK